MMAVCNWRLPGFGNRGERCAASMFAGLLRGAGLAGAGVLMAGCATHVEPEVRTVRVEVPVQVPCRAPDVAVPPWAAASLRRTDSLEVKVRALLAERRQRIGYEKELAAAAGACR